MVSGIYLPFSAFAGGVLASQFWNIVHGSAGVLLIAVILAHICTLGMEGAAAAITTGEVVLNWAKEHHSLWVEVEEAKAKDLPHGVQPAEHPSTRRQAATAGPDLTGLRDGLAVNRASLYPPGVLATWIGHEDRGPCRLERRGKDDAASRDHRTAYGSRLQRIDGQTRAPRLVSAQDGRRVGGPCSF